MKSDIPQRTLEFAKRIVQLCLFLEGQQGVSRILVNQILRSGTSIGANVEEGVASQSDADFISKYSIACKEARETHYWLRLIAETNVVPADRLTEITDECGQLIAILTTIIKKMKEKTNG